MESRDAQDAGAVQRSGAFSGRQVPLEMGTLRVGGSGRPVPAVFSAAASRRAVTSSLDVAAAPSIAISPRLTLERHPRSPFRRREELSKTVVRSRDDSSRSRFQVKKITGPHPLSARSPQIRRTGRRTMGSDVATRSHETKTSRSNEVVVAHDGQSQQLEQNGEQTRQRKEEVSEVVRTGREELTFQVGERRSDVDATPRREPSTHFVEEKPHSSERRIGGHRSRALPLAASSTLGTFVSCTPSLTKLRSSFTARELALFTHRQDHADSDAKSQARYHVASHPHSAAVTSPPAALETDQERSLEKPSDHKRTVSSVAPPRDPKQIPVVSGKRNVESSWTRVDTSIDHIYDDPAIDMVQMHLLHSHHTTSGQKKRKMVERERVLSAASGLREQQSEVKRQQEQIQQRKLQVQKMSEAIRQQNQRAVRARAVHSAGVNGRRPKLSQRADSAPILPERKPPVPRLSRNGATPKQPKRKKKPKDDSRLQGVSTSILMGLPSDSSREVSRQVLETDGEGEGAKEEEEDGVMHDEASKPLAKQQTAKRRPPASTPRASKREKRSIKPPENNAAIRAKEERRAIAREYMQLQKNSRRIWNAKVKEQAQREQEKRQQQLEILEATRLKKLRLAKKRAHTNPTKQGLVDPVLPEDDAMVTIAMSISPRSSSTPYGNAVDTPSKRENMEKGRDEEISFDEPHVDDENDRALGNRNVSKHRSTNFGASPFRSAELVESVEVRRDEKRVAPASERVQKLLELREKAAALSARLSGLRKQQGASTEVLATEPESKHDPSTNDVARSTSDDRGSKTPTDNPVDQPDLNVARSSTGDVLGSVTSTDSPAAAAKGRYGESESGSDNEIDEDAEGDRNTGNGSGEESDDGRSDSSDVDKEGDGAMESRNGSSVSEEGDDSLIGSQDDQFSEAEASPVASSQQIVQQTRAFSAASATLDGDVDIDIRSIGVYNIGVVWPLNSDEATEAKSEANVSPASGSSSSSSSGSSSPTSSPRGLQRLLLAGQLEDSHDESRGGSEGAFEVAFYDQLKGKLQRSTIESKAAPSLSYREEREADAMSASESDSNSAYSPARTLQSGLSPVNGTSPVLMNQSRQPNEGLIRLIRETDDSLSVVDRAAKALYREQVERLEREKETELQIRIEAEKKALLEKDLALKAVMESLTGKIASDDDSDGSGGSHSEDDAAGVQDAQYKRLEEIMDEVERERARENGDNRTSSPDRGITLDERQTATQPSMENRLDRGGIRVSTSSSIFWDQLVSDSALREHDGEHLNVARPHVAVDDSELVAQREARLQEEDERKAGYDSPPRVHSPRTLSKRLMAAVDYQEAIYEAHMQLAMMEHAHELETVQAETITLAQAFKEEMENNATSHQLALDHATLEKKFDDDMQDVMQQLTTIREAEQQERVARESQLEQQLRQANLRECSVQTEASQRADAATSAALYVDTSTSPARFVSDAAVQASPPVVSVRRDGGAVADDVAASEYSEESKSGGDVDEADVQLASAEEVISETAQGEQYSSQFEDASRGNSMRAIQTKKNSVDEIPNDDEISEVSAAASGHNDEDDNAGIAAVSEELRYSDDAFESGQVEETEVSYSERLQQSEVGDDAASSIGEEGEDIIVDAHETSGGKADSENYEAEYENDYESASFDEAQPASEVYSEDAPASVEDYPEDEVVPSVGEEEEEIIAEHEASEAKADSGNYEAEYENDYESASFDEAQSAAGAPSEDAPPRIEESHEIAVAPTAGEDEEESIVDEHESSGSEAESINDEAEYENDYEDASFDEAQSATDVPSNDVRDSVEKHPDDDAVPSIDEEEGELIDEKKASEGQDEADTYEAETENDYESAPFEAQSTTDLPSDDVPPPVEEYPEPGAVGDPARGNSGGDEVPSDDNEESEHYSSQFEDTSRVNAGNAEQALRDAGEISSDEEGGSAYPDSFSEESKADMAATHGNPPDDTTESRQEGQPVVHYSEHLLGEQSVSIREEQSSSEDSSTTKLLVAEVSTLQKVVEESSPARAQAEAERIARKKAKATELLQAKERLLSQQKEAFRREEEKRQVDIMAKLALKFDVKGELHRAKAEIAQQLASEFDALQQEYPIVSRHAGGTTDESRAVDPSVATKPGVTSPSAMSKLFSPRDAVIGSVDYDEGDVEYESESFEEDRSEAQGESDAPADEVSGKPLETQPRREEVEIEASNDQAASQVSSHQSEVGDEDVPSIVEEEEDNAFDDRETSEGNVPSEGDNYEEEYENDYENESFDEVQSTTDATPGDAPGPLEEYSAKADTVGEEAHENAGQQDEDDDADAYSDEGFDSASGSFASEAPTRATASQSHAPGSPLAASTSVKEEELTQAIEVVAGQIQEDEPADELSIAQAEQTASVPRAAEDSKSMLTSVSISASHDAEEEILTKSIEERMTRLEALRQKIADRKGEILGVQKQMRVEKRREQVVAEERLLWDEMEAVEKLLRADEAALALCRQRNRLEIMNLEARQLTHASGTENREGNERPIDLLSGFDYVEEACVDEAQKRSLGETMMARSRAVRGFDLLEGYVYIEDAEPGKCHTDERIHPAPAPTIAEPGGVDEVLNGENSDSTGNDEANSGSENGDQGQAQDMAEAEDSMQEEVVSDLLNGYNYVEDADPIDRHTDVSILLGAVPSMEAPDDECESESEANTVAVGNGPELCDHSQDVASSEGSVREQTLLDLLDDYNYVEDVEPVNCGGDEPMVSTAVPRKTELDCESEASCGDSEPDEQHIEPSVEAPSNGPPEAMPREDNELDRAAQSERMTDEVFASIFDDIINSELRIWSHRRLAASTHSTSSPEETVISADKSTVIATAYLGHSVEPVKQMTDEESRERALNSTRESEERQETVSDEPRFPALPDDLIPQDVLAEASELPVIREQSERELEQQVQLLTDEASAEGLHGDELISQNCISSNVSNIVSDVRVERQDMDVSERSAREQAPIDLLGEYTYVEDAEPADCDVDEPMVSIAVPRKTEPDDEVAILYEDAEADEQTIRHITDGLPCASSEAAHEGDGEVGRAAESERVTDEIFASVLDDIINSELRIWSRRKLAAPTQRSPQRSVDSANASTTAITATFGNSPKHEKREADEASKGRDLNVTQQLVERLEIVNGELRLPTLREVTKASASPVARVLYDTVEALAQDCFNAIQQTAAGEIPLGQTSVLHVIQQHVEAEVRELLAIREQSERELERQVQLLSDETGAVGLNRDVLLSQNCIASNVSSIVSKVQSDLSRTTEDLSTAAQPARSGMFSRTPVSRARSTSILSSLQTQQDQELQQRLTGLILSDLLHDAGLP